MNPVFLSVSSQILSLQLLLLAMGTIQIIQDVFFISLGIQLIYWLSFFRLIFYNSKSGNSQPKPISIIVCAWNEEKNLKELVPLLLKQEHPDFEVVIVDDRSVDDTYDFLIEHRETDPKLKVVRIDSVPDHVNAKKYALTLGIKAAKNDLVLLTDADCRPQSLNWAKSVSLEHNDDSVFVMGYSPYRFKSSLLNLFIQYETLLTGIHYLSAVLWKTPYMAVGRNLSYRKSFFLAQKGFVGFQHTVGGDDDLFVNRHAKAANSKICISKDAIVESFAKDNWTSYLTQKKRHLSVGKHYRMRDKFRLTVFSVSQILLWICFVTLSILTINTYVILGGFGLRLTLQLIVIGFGAKKLSSKFPIVLLPAMDLIFAVFLSLVSVPALLSKKIKWS